MPQKHQNTKMKRLIALTCLKGFLSITLIALLFIGCASKRNVSDASMKGVTFEYNMPQNETLKYKFVSNAVESAEVQKKKIDAHYKTNINFTIEAKESESELIDLLVSIDEMLQQFNIAGKEIKADLSTVIGEQFNMKLSDKGTGLDVSEATKIKYDIVPGKTRDMGTHFKTMFPELPATVINKGDHWTTVDTIEEDLGEGLFRIIINSNNVLEGFETFNGKNCARITADFKGSIYSHTKEGEANIMTTGTIKGNDLWFFAFEEGLLVKMDSKGTAKTITEVNGKKNMTIPGSREFTYLTELLD